MTDANTQNDAELIALATVAEVYAGLDHDAQQRVTRYLFDRFVAATERPTGEMTHGYAVRIVAENRVYRGEAYPVGALTSMLQAELDDECRDICTENAPSRRDVRKALALLQQVSEAVEDLT